MTEKEMLQKAREDFLEKHGKTPEEAGLHTVMFFKNKRLWPYPNYQHIIFARSTKAAEAFKTTQTMIDRVLSSWGLFVLYISGLMLYMILRLKEGDETAAFISLIAICIPCIIAGFACIIYYRKGKPSQELWTHNCIIHSFINSKSR